MYKIYRIVDGDESFLTDNNIYYNVDSITEVSVGDVTLEELIYTCESAFENANYHRLIGITKQWIDKITEVTDSDTAKLILWHLIRNKSFFWIDR